MAKKAATPAPAAGKLSKNASRQAGETYTYQSIPAEKAAKSLADLLKIPVDQIATTSYARNTVVIRNQYATQGNVVKRAGVTKRMMPGNAVWLSYPGESDHSAFFANGNPVLIEQWFDGRMTNLVIGYTRG
jgi:hypothetical protein